MVPGILHNFDLLMETPASRRWKWMAWKPDYMCLLLLLLEGCKVPHEMWKTFLSKFYNLSYFKIKNGKCHMRMALKDEEVGESGKIGNR